MSKKLTKKSAKAANENKVVNASDVKEALTSATETPNAVEDIDNVVEKEVETPMLNPQREIANAIEFLDVVEKNRKNYQLDKLVVDCKTLVSSEQFSKAYETLESEVAEGDHTVFSFVKALKTIVKAKPKKVAEKVVVECTLSGCPSPALQNVDKPTAENCTYFVEYYCGASPKLVSQLMKYLRGNISKFDVIHNPFAWDNAVDYDATLVRDNASADLAQFVQFLCNRAGLMSPTEIMVDDSINVGDKLLVTAGSGYITYDVIGIGSDGIQLFNADVTRKKTLPDGTEVEYDILQKFDGYTVYRSEEFTLVSDDVDINNSFETIMSEKDEVTEVICGKSVDLAEHKRGYVTYVCFRGKSLIDGIASGDIIALPDDKKGSLGNKVKCWLKLNGVKLNERSRSTSSTRSDEIKEKEIDE